MLSIRRRCCFVGLTRVLVGAGAICGGGLIGSAWLLAQQPDARQTRPVFTADTELVQVDVSVLDNRRRPVTGLTAADFTILENGQPRPIEAFTEVALPAQERASEAAWTRAVAPDVVTNQATEQEGRLVVILMDRSIPLGQPTFTARRIAQEAVETLGPGDLAAVVSTSGPGAVQGLTADRARLLQVINDPGRDWSTGRSRADEAIERSQFENEATRSKPGDTLPSLAFNALGPISTPLTDGRCLCGTCVPNAIERIAETVSEVPRRRKLLLFIGSGVEWQTEEIQAACNFHLRDAREAMFRALDRASLTVHSIDPSGVDVREQQYRTPRTEQLARQAAMQSPVKLIRPGMDDTETDSAVKQQNSLGVLPDRTGGRMVTNTNAPQEHVPAIFAESESYYVLGFAPADRDTSRPVRSIDVRVNRRGVTVYARKQYVVPGAQARLTSEAPAIPAALGSASLSDALGGLLPATRVPMALHVAAFATPGSSRSTVTVSADVGAFAPVASTDAVPGAEVNAPLELVVGAYDMTGRPQASARQTLELAWPVASPDAPTRRVEALSRLDLAPGTYEIRVAAAAGTADVQTASVFTHVTVPAYATEPVAVSHLIFGAAPGTSAVPPEMLRAVLPAAPTTQRTFARTDEVLMYAQVYQGTARTEPLAPAQVRVRMVDAQDVVMLDHTLAYGPEKFATRRTADVGLVLPFAHLVPGEYLVSLEVTLGDRTAGRGARFTVR